MDLFIKLGLHAYFEVELAAVLSRNICHVNERFERTVHLAGRYDLQLGHCHGIDPFLNPAEDGRDVRRGANHLERQQISPRRVKEAVLKETENIPRLGLGYLDSLLRAAC